MADGHGRAFPNDIQVKRRFRVPGRAEDVPPAQALVDQIYPEATPAGVAP
jgi:hypothetical protein